MDDDAKAFMRALVVELTGEIRDAIGAIGAISTKLDAMTAPQPVQTGVPKATIVTSAPSATSGSSSAGPDASWVVATNTSVPAAPTHTRCSAEGPRPGTTKSTPALTSAAAPTAPPATVNADPVDAASSAVVLEVALPTCPTPEQDTRLPSASVTAVALLQEGVSELVLIPEKHHGSSSPTSVDLEALDVAPIAVDVKATDLATTVPTSCSSECPSHDAAIPLSVSRHCSNDVPISPPLTRTAESDLELRPLPWPSFECSQSVLIREKISGLIYKHMGITSGDDTKYGDVRNDASVDRVPSPLLESIVKLVMSLRYFGGSLHLPFARPLQEVRVYWSLPCLQVYRSHFQLKLVIASSLQTLGSYCLNSDHDQWDPEMMHWKFLGSHPLRDSSFQFYPAAKASLYGYGAAQFECEIAWPTTTLAYSILYTTLKCSSVICYLEIGIKCSVMHLLGLCSFWPYMQNIGANGRLSSEKNSLLSSCCFSQGTQLNCNFGHYRQVNMGSYLDREENPWLASINFQLEQSRMAKFAAIVYMCSYAATMCHQFSSGHPILLIPAATCSAMDFYFFPGLGAVIVCFPGYEGQLTARVLTACVGMLQTDNCYPRRLSSWKDAMLVVNRWILMSCNLYVWNSFEMELVFGVYGSSCLNGHFIQRACVIMQWKIPWLFTCPILVELVELKPWPYWALFPCISAVTRVVQPACDHWKFHVALLFSWDVSSTIDSVPTIQRISGGAAAACGQVTLDVIAVTTFFEQVSTGHNYEYCQAEVATWEDPEDLEQASVLHKYYLNFDEVRASTNYYLDAYFDWVPISYDDSFVDTYYLDPVYNDLKYHREDYGRNINKLKEVHTPWDPGKSALRHPSKASAWGQAEFQGGRIVSNLSDWYLYMGRSFGPAAGPGPSGNPQELQLHATNAQGGGIAETIPRGSGETAAFSPTSGSTPRILFLADSLYSKLAT